MGEGFSRRGVEKRGGRVCPRIYANGEVGSYVGTSRQVFFDGITGLGRDGEDHYGGVGFTLYLRRLRGGR